jgi:hypothetical protein
MDGLRNAWPRSLVMIVDVFKLVWSGGLHNQHCRSRLRVSSVDLRLSRVSLLVSPVGLVHQSTLARSTKVASGTRKIPPDLLTSAVTRLVTFAVTRLVTFAVTRPVTFAVTRLVTFAVTRQIRFSHAGVTGRVRQT